ncbi:hypothetical protein [Spirulina sp. 06S082]|uniref:hypothetical protein n=1 Tax=Spirulina sp. 06S082 TaxID=3110248 RepID=UPI002B215FFE|nr:hypothetical protein [Spirulina sp. 06S082]MEA5470038.1 hypothetical protein [Spirulina sp. 06S082]
MTEKNNVVIEDMIVAIAQIPQEHWGNLLQMIKLFQDSANPKPEKAIDPYLQLKEELENPDPIIEVARQKALSDLLKEWDNDDDVEEQKETWEILSSLC